MTSMGGSPRDRTLGRPRCQGTDFACAAPLRAISAISFGMDFQLTDSQRALQETARKYARDVIRPKAAHYDETAEFPKEIIAQGFELGLMNMSVPEQYGGVGLSHLDQAIVAEELSWGCAGVATSMIASDLSLLPIILAGTEEQKRR